MPSTIRPATEADQRTIRSQIRKARLPPMNLQWPNFVLAEEDGQVIGVGQVKSHSDGSRELASIAIIPGRQREGIGTAVISKLLAREARVVLQLSCRPELRRHAQRFGSRRLVPAC